jgi:hypothetical protein
MACSFDLVLEENTISIYMMTRGESEQIISGNRDIVIVRTTTLESIEYFAKKKKRPDIIERVARVKEIVRSEIKNENEQNSETVRRVLMEFHHENLLPILTISCYFPIKSLSDGVLTPPGFRHTQIFSLDHFFLMMKMIKNVGPTMLYGQNKSIRDIQQIPGLSEYEILRKIPESLIKEQLIPGS